MIINRLMPQGYCGGVKRAIEIAYKALDDPSTKKPIYLLGSIIHNRFVVNDLESKGAIIIDEPNKTRLELLERINIGTVIFSAHGVSDKVYETAKNKGLNIIDTTCGYVKVVQNKIKEYLAKGYTCLYIGTPKHPECEAILNISSSIILITNEADLGKININNPNIYVTNQTTLSIYDTNDLYDKIVNKYPSAIIDNKICQATTIRQKAVETQNKVDLCIVVGDEKSSNTKKLALVSQKAGINTILVEDLNSLKKIDLKNVHSVSITSGASTPDYIVEEIIEYLKKLD